MDMFTERNTGSNLPAQIELYATPGSAYSFLFMAKVGGACGAALSREGCVEGQDLDRTCRWLHSGRTMTVIDWGVRSYSSHSTTVIDWGVRQCFYFHIG